jgi:glycerol-3-phosphate dehydrogenase
MVDDSRLVMRVLQDSIDDGAHALNYTKVNNLIIENDKVCGVAIEDIDNNGVIELRAAAVINATGAWADRLRNEVNSETRIRPLRGSHIIIPKSLYPVSNVMTFLHHDDKRGVYVYPWEGTTVLGTTDLDHAEDLDIEASISDQETDYLLNAFNLQFPNNSLTRADIISTWAGVRPVIGAEQGKNPSKERRDHAVWSDNGLITVSGGKLTTFRLIALDALAAAAAQLPTPASVVNDAMFVTPDFSASDLLPNNPKWAQRLLGRYGNKARTLLQESASNEQLSLGDTEFCMAECRWAIKHEAVQHLDDLLLRRTRLGMCLPRGGDDLYPALKALFATERQWNDQRWETEINRYNAIWNTYYSLPNNP